MRQILRSAYLSWEFWIPGLLFFIGLSCWIWFSNHNQDLIRKQQIEESRKVSVEQVTSKIQALTSQLMAIKEQREILAEKVSTQVTNLTSEVKDLKQQRRDVAEQVSSKVQTLATEVKQLQREIKDRKP